MASRKIKGKNIEDNIRKNGFRLTGTRKTIFNILSVSKNKLTAEEIFIKARKKNPKIGLATIYRTIGLLENFELIEKIKLDDNKTKYMINDRFDSFTKSFPKNKKHISKIKKINTPGKNIKQKNKFSLNKVNNTQAVNPGNMEFLDFSKVKKIQEQLDKWISELNKIKNEKEIKLEEMMNDFSKIDKLVERHSNDSSNLIQILLDVQGEYKWLPKHALLYVGNKLDVPLTRIYSIASFYKFFNLTPKGKYEIIVCTGTACHVRGSMNLLQRIINILKIKPGDTTPDYRFTLDTVNCLGCCALGPVMYFNKKYYSNPSSRELKKLFKVPAVN